VSAQDRPAARRSGLTSCAENVIGRLFARRHESPLMFQVARGSVRDAQMWLRFTGRKVRRA
jgi:hypothetical protein